MRQPHTGSAGRPATVSVAEALRSRFPLDAGNGRRPARPSVAEALRSRFPQPRTPADDPLPGSAGRPAGPVLPRRLRRDVPVPARHAQAASPELLRRVRDGLQRL
jgi:hypothetical protein